MALVFKIHMNHVFRNYNSTKSETYKSPSLKKKTHSQTKIQ
jgi:hypothetical protein